MARITVHMGHYGSGKTEISLNTALELAGRGQPVTLVDLDIVNPYFRSGEQRDRLTAAGVRVVMPTFEGTNVDVPALPADVQSVFADPGRRVIFDVGGDPAGAAALGRYKPYFVREDVDALCVVNTCRPFTGSAGEVEAMVRTLEERSRLTVTGLIHNSNLARETTAGLVVAGQPVVEEAADRLCIPVTAIYGLPSVIEGLPGVFRSRYRDIIRPLILYMRPEWLDEGSR